MQFQVVIEGQLPEVGPTSAFRVSPYCASEWWAPFTATTRKRAGLVGRQLALECPGSRVLVFTDGAVLGHCIYSSTEEVTP
jgi:hypothetical protein